MPLAKVAVVEAGEPDGERPEPFACVTASYAVAGGATAESAQFVLGLEHPTGAADALDAVVRTMARGERAVAQGGGRRVAVALHSWAGPHDLTLDGCGGALKLRVPPAVPGVHAGCVPLDAVTVVCESAEALSGAMPDALGELCAGAPVTFCTDRDGPCEGLDLAVQSLHPGEAADFVLREGGAVVRLRLRLEAVARRRAAEWALPQLLDLMTGRRKAGNAQFAQGGYGRAVRIYSAALGSVGEEDEAGLPDDAPALAELRAEQLACHLNIAACLLKLGEHSRAVQACEVALAIDPDNAKGLYRRGCARSALAEYAAAERDLQRAAALGGGRAATDALRVLRERRAAADAEDRCAFAGMFDADRYGPEDALVPAPPPAPPAVRELHEPPAELRAAARRCPGGRRTTFEPAFDPYIPGDWNTAQCYHCEYVLGQHPAGDREHQGWEPPEGPSPLAYGLALAAKVPEGEARTLAWRDYFNGAFRSLV